ncbi:hypothetical protein [Methylovirgula sp. HY1]|uniref:hypothetical protein n=1 Tax=Methylovirgula sp. HY1 TaxID=2822761 RepID=UPI001C74F3CA|nr:hypothetical protein [Methylovirgula sp. HY1]QXX74850.1 hypothetical protein MHY1_01667 [Methylovirgula sp. HY1]
MKSPAILFSLCLFGLSGTAVLATSEAHAKPGGCIKYGAAGAVAGHYAGHHAVKGALAGCAAGMWRRHEYKKHLREEKKLQTTAPNQD